jgi:predicted GNAT family acetyltransferase
MDNLVLRDNPERHRFEAFAGDSLAGYVEYSHLSRALMFSHTEVLPAFEGKGVGGFLARESITAARHVGKQVIPVCPFIAGYLRKHRELLDVVDPDVQRAYRI